MTWLGAGEPLQVVVAGDLEPRMRLACLLGAR